MPPLPRVRVQALAHALGPRARPADALALLERVEALARSVTPQASYPLAQVLRALALATPASADDASVIPGPALARDLAALAEHASAAAHLDRSRHQPPDWLSPDDLLARWSVSRSTLDRLRRLGLLARRIERDPSGALPAEARALLAFAAADVRRFESLHADRIARARGFTRLTARETRSILRRAARYQRVLGWSMSRTAHRLAERFDRSPETIRQVLLRAGAPTAEHASVPTPQIPVVDRDPPIRAAQRRVILRALRMGVSVERIAERYRRTKGSIYRAQAQAQADRLRELAPALPAWFDAGEHAELLARGARARFLDLAPVQTNLGRPAPADAAALLAWTRRAEVVTPATERAWGCALWFLRLRARHAIAGLPRHNPVRSRTGGVEALLDAGLSPADRVPDAPAGIDDIETVLRWASRLKAELVRAQLPLVCRTIEAAAGRTLSSLPPHHAASVLLRAIRTVADGVERHDPFAPGRLAAPVGLALNRTIAVWTREVLGTPEHPRALNRGPRSAFPDFTAALDSWQHDLEPSSAARAHLPSLPPDRLGLLVERLGWQAPTPAGILGGTPPRSLDTLAKLRGVSVSRLARLEHEALADLCARARAGGPAPLPAAHEVA